MTQSFSKPSEKQKLPIAKNEDVEFSWELADEDDREAVDRAEQADRRQERGTL